MLEKQSQLSFIIVPLNAFVLSMVLLVGSSDAGSLSAVKKEDAIKVANKEVEKLGFDLREAARISKDFFLRML